MLSGWFRMKYPQVVDGALAASAPLLMYQNITSPYAFYETVTNDFTNVGCGGLMRDGFQQLQQLQNKTEHYETLTKELNLCEPIKSAGDVQGLYDWMLNGMGTMCMIDYPYPTNFIAPVPGSPVTVACERLLSAIGSDVSPSEMNFLSEDPAKKPTSSDFNIPLLKGMVDAVNVLYDYQEKNSCNNPPQSGGPGGWYYLACTEQVLPIATNGVTDFFWDQPWSLKENSAQCEIEWGTPSRPFWVPRHYGGFNYQRDFAMYSNIIFSQGNLDPWHLGGVNHDIIGGKDMISFVMKGSAHHLDLRYPDPADPIDVVRGRETEDFYVGKWIRETIERNLRESS